MVKKTASLKRSSALSLVLSAGITLFVIFVLFAFLFPFATQVLVVRRLSRATGLPVKIEQVHFSVRRPQFWMKGLQLSNPTGFPSGKLAEAGLVQVRYRRLPLLVGHLRPRKVEVYFKEFRLIRNGKGNLNLPKISQSPQAKATIGELALNLDTVTYTDLSGGRPLQKTFDVRLAHEVYRNVKGVSGIVEIVNWEVLKRTGIGEETKPVIPAIKPTPETPQPSATPPVLTVASQPAKTNPNVSDKS